MHTFAVDAVEPASTRLPTKPLTQRLPEVLALGVDGAMETVEVGRLHPLMAAVHLAFSEHRPLVLSPDAIWLTIAQGVAHHVRLNAEHLRSRFVRHPGKKTLEVRHDGPFPSDPASIAALVSRFRGALAAEVGAGPTRLFTCDFTTSGESERVASEIVLLDAFSPYFDLLVTCVCGIPEITVTGTPDDWRSIRRRIDVIEEFELEWWTRSLAGIIDRFVDAADGRPDVAFFKRIYKPRESYGEDRVTGWIARLWPYVREDGAFRARNPLLAERLSWEPPESSSSFSAPGVPPSSVPAAPSSCLVNVRDPLGQRLGDAVFTGGLLAVEQDPDGRLVPRAGWFARRSRASLGLVLDEIVAHHAAVQWPAPPRETIVRAKAAGVMRKLDFVVGASCVEEPVELTGQLAARVVESNTLKPRLVVAGVEHPIEPGLTVSLPDGAHVQRNAVLACLPPRGSSGPAEVMALDDRLVEATLFASTRPWRILPIHARSWVRLGKSECVERMIDLFDGTFIARADSQASSRWVRMRADLVEGERGTQTSREDPRHITVVAHSLAELLNHALETSGSTELLTLGTLS